MRVDIAFTPAEEVSAPVGIAQALASGYERVRCYREIDEARELRARIPDSLVGGERNAVRIEGFDVGASPREFLEPRARTLILSTTNGTTAILEAAGRCDTVLLGSLLNLEALVRTVRVRGEDTRRRALGRGDRCRARSARLPRRVRRPDGAHVRPARARGGHPFLRTTTSRATRVSTPAPR